MLQSLHIQNVVLIENLSIDFQSGLCALTGETGAGKSILLDSLGLATGARSEARLVRKGAEQAIVTASFYVAESKILDDIFTDNGLSWNAGDILLKRQVGHDGRSRAWINDQPVSIGLLKEIVKSSKIFTNYINSDSIMINIYKEFVSQEDELRMWGECP